MISEQDQVPLDLLICELHRVLIQHHAIQCLVVQRLVAQRLIMQRLVMQRLALALSVMMRALRSMDRHGHAGGI